MELMVSTYQLKMMVTGKLFKCTVSFWLCFFVLVTINTTIAQEERPNVLLICVDDLRDWVGYMGGYKGEVHTPNMDELANAGMAFTNAHTASPLCCPSRNALLLGKRPSTTGLYDNSSWWKATYPNEVPLPQYFKQHGYYVAGAGKVFHHTPGNNPPCSWDIYHDQLFDDPWSISSFSVERNFSVGYRAPFSSSPSWLPLNGMLPAKLEMDWGAIPNKPDTTYGDVKTAVFATEFLQQKHEKPFFLAVGIYRPHMPWYVPQRFFDQYPLDGIVLPEVLDGDLDDLPEEGRALATVTSEVFRQVKEEGKWKEAVQAYLASISFADEQVGNIYRALKKSPNYENTIVILWSDHGWHLGTKEHWHKSTLWEECTRVPFIVKVPGLTKPGTICDAPVDLVNVYPTLLSLCDLPSRSDLDGHDMRPLLSNPKSEWKWPAITQFKPGQIAIRTASWRYIRYRDGTYELYHTQSDPLEWHNLAHLKKYSEIIAEHRKWIPVRFATKVPGKARFVFDPSAYTWVDKESKVFIDGKK